jgi:ESS family glutamate:Na+ symporter
MRCFVTKEPPYRDPARDLHIPAFQSFTLAILLFFVGQKLAAAWAAAPLQHPRAGGGWLSVRLRGGAGLRGAGAAHRVRSAGARPAAAVLLAGIGLKSDLKTLKEGGKPLVILLVLASGFIVLQNVLGMGLAGLFGLDPRAGLMTGSIAPDRWRGHHADLGSALH